jgi:hypothetical protein
MPPSEQTKIEVLKVQMNNLETKVDKIDVKQDALSDKMDKFMNEIRNGYVRNEDFTFWRNILVSGLLLAIGAAVIAKYLNVPLK